MEKWIIDRFEGGFAVCEREGGQSIDIPREKLPQSAKEGDVLCVPDTVSIEIDAEGTKERKKKIEKLMDDLFL